MNKERFTFLEGFSLQYNCIMDNEKEGDKFSKVLTDEDILNLLNNLDETVKFQQESIQEKIHAINDFANMFAKQKQENDEFERRFIEILDNEINKNKKLKDTSLIADVSYICLTNLKNKICGDDKK